MAAKYSTIYLDDGRRYVREGDEIIAPLDWRWRSAQPGDVWVPKRGRAGKAVTLRGPFRSNEIVVGAITIEQVHNADRAVMARSAEGVRHFIKWSELRRNWRAASVRPVPER
jgi:hypothetical protein